MRYPCADEIKHLKRLGARVQSGRPRSIQQNSTQGRKVTEENVLPFF